MSLGGGDKKSPLPNLVNPIENRIDTTKKLADVAGVGKETYRMGAKILNSDNEDLKQRVLSGETAISTGYKELIGKKEKSKDRRIIRTFWYGLKL